TEMNGFVIENAIGIRESRHITTEERLQVLTVCHDLLDLDRARLSREKKVILRMRADVHSRATPELAQLPRRQHAMTCPRRQIEAAPSNHGGQQFSTSITRQ